jgi:hypothetical protein
MRRLLSAVLGVYMLVLFAPAMSQAETVTFCDSFPRQTIRDFSLSVHSFDRPGCLLLGAQVQLDVLVDGAFYGENTGNCLAGGCSENDSTHVSLAFTDLNGAAVGSQHDYSKHHTLTSYDGALDFAGTSGYTDPYVWPAYSAWPMSYSSLGQFLTPQSVFVDTDAFWSRSGPGNGTYGVRTYVTGKVCVTYTYSCPVGAEPSTWGRMKVLYR